MIKESRGEIQMETLYVMDFDTNRFGEVEVIYTREDFEEVKDEE